MFTTRKPDPWQRAATAQTVLAAQSSFNGTLRVEGSVRIEGACAGTVHATATIFVGSQAQVTAALQAQQVLIAGTVRANVQAQVVGLLSGAQVFGNITTREFSSEEDSSFQGELLLLE